MRVPVFALGLSCLASTVGGQGLDAGSQIKAARAACMHNPAIKTVVESQRCAGRAEESILRAAGFQWMDLEYQNEVDHLQVAQDIDSRRITVEEGALEMDAADSRMSQAINERVAQIQSRLAPSPAPQEQQDTTLAERQREARICFNAGLLSSGPFFAQGMANAENAYINCLNGRPPVTQRPPSETYCTPTGNGTFACTTQ